MHGSDSSTQIYEQFRLLVLTDRRRARNQLNEWLDRDDGVLDPLLKLMSAPSEGRVRQLVANTVRLRHDASKLTNHLRAWHEYESDEFTRKAIEAALDSLTDVSDAPLRSERRTQQRQELSSKEAISVYRWFAGRLCHRVRNALSDPAAAILKLERFSRKLPPGDDVLTIQQEIALLKTMLTRVSRVVEFDTSDNYLEWKEIPLWPTLNRIAGQYAARFEPVQFALSGPAAEFPVSIVGTELLIETVLWNLLKNASEAVGPGCRVEAIASGSGDQVTLDFVDNGSGLLQDEAEDAFSVAFSSKKEFGGQGLLEVADAVSRLRGIAEVVHLRDAYRVRISLPVASQ